MTLRCSQGVTKKRVADKASCSRHAALKRLPLAPHEEL